MRVTESSEVGPLLAPFDAGDRNFLCEDICIFKTCASLLTIIVKTNTAIIT